MSRENEYTIAMLQVKDLIEEFIKNVSQTKPHDDYHKFGLFIGSGNYSDFDANGNLFTSATEQINRIRFTIFNDQMRIIRGLFFTIDYGTTRIINWRADRMPFNSSVNWNTVPLGDEITALINKCQQKLPKYQFVSQQSRFLTCQTNQPLYFNILRRNNVAPDGKIRSHYDYAVKSISPDIDLNENTERLSYLGKDEADLLKGHRVHLLTMIGKNTGIKSGVDPLKQTGLDQYHLITDQMPRKTKIIDLNKIDNRRFGYQDFLNKQTVQNAIKKYRDEYDAIVIITNNEMATKVIALIAQLAGITLNQIGCRHYNN